MDINTMQPSSGRMLKEDNSVINMADLATPKLHTFHDAVTDASVPNGVPYLKDGRKTIRFGIGGTSTSQSYQFRGVDAAGNDNLILCFRTSDLSSATGTSAKGETWDASIEGLESFYVKLISVSGGTSIVKGEATV